MNHLDRRKLILEQLESEGSVSVNELTARFAVGSATIRRDLKFLSENYGVSVSYGGAYLRKRMMSQSVIESSLSNRQQLNLSEKKTIAQKAAALVTDGATISLNSGTTVELVLNYLSQSLSSINLITICLNVAMKASALPFMEVYIPGGKIRGVSKALVGRSVVKELSNFNVDIGFFGVSAVDLRKGVMHPATEEIETNQALMDICNRSYLVCDSSKFGTTSLAKMFDLTDFDGLIVDGSVPDSYREFASQNGIEVV
jgi:DeoR/GlpR family transcriptional regulator of sugar metabolism